MPNTPVLSGVGPRLADGRFRSGEPVDTGRWTMRLRIEAGGLGVEDHQGQRVQGHRPVQGRHRRRGAGGQGPRREQR